MRCKKENLSGWGLYPQGEARLWRPERMGQLEIKGESLLARGLGRSYGDAALNSGRDLLLVERLDRMIDFDEKKGLLRAEGGLSLAALLEAFVPRGWFLPVTPGTKFATLGGCLAADVHGKNHHCDGSFSRYVADCELLLADGSLRRCSPTRDSALFWATAGGMGLTGVIRELTLQLIPIPSAYMEVRHYAARNLDEALALLNDAGCESRYSVAWIDCLATGNSFGRSVVMNGDHAPAERTKKENPLLLPKRKEHSLPFHLPSWALNRWAIKAFNGAYYKVQGAKKAPFLQDYESYFYPLDALSHWNRMYGKRGFLQYQCLLPEENGLKGVLAKLAASQRASFLAVLKRFGEGNSAPLSFPGKGYTLALDLPLRDEGIFPFLDSLDDYVVSCGGRCYLAKDARMSSAIFRKMYPRFGEWLEVKERADPKWRFQSDLSRRLQMEEGR